MRDEIARTSLLIAFSGAHAHPEPAAVVSGLSAEAAGTLPEGASRTIYEQVGHLVYWQDVFLDWIDGVVPETPGGPEESWPDEPAPGSQAAWEDLVARFIAGVDRAAAIARHRDLESPMAGVEGAQVGGTLASLAAHNSWHLGQILQLRRQLGEWAERAPAG